MRHDGRPATRRNRRAGLLAILAMLLYPLAPLLPAAPAAASADLIQIGTAHGVVWVPVSDMDGTPPPAGMPDCPACALTVHGHAPAKAALPAAIAVRLPLATAMALPPPRATSAPPQTELTAAQPRGPPLPA